MSKNSLTRGDKLLDLGNYTWENPDNRFAGVEIPGDQEYVVC